MGVTFVAFVLRVTGVGIPPLLDGESIIGIAATSVAETGQNMLPAGHPYNRGELVTHLSGLSIWLLGKSAFALRAPMVLIGTATVPTVYLLAREVFDTRVALFGATLQTFALLNVAWSRTARFYTILQLFMMVGLLLYLRLDGLVSVDYLERSVDISDRRKVAVYAGLFCIVLTLGSQVHRGWLLLPAIVGLHLTVPFRTEPIPVMQAKTAIWGLILLNALYVIFAMDLLVPSVLFDVLGIGKLDSVSIWLHPYTNMPPLFFYISYYPLLSVFAVVGSFVVLWRRRRTEVLIFLGMYASLFFFTYFGENFRFIWRPRYLLFTLPFFLLLAASGLERTLCWLVKRVPTLDPLSDNRFDLSVHDVLLVVAAVLLIMTPASAGVQFTTDPHTLSRLEVPRSNYKGGCQAISGDLHTGDAVVTNRPNQLYFWTEKVDYRGNRKTAEWTAVPGRDHYTGAKIIGNESEMKQVIRSHDRIWVVYNPFMPLVGESWIKEHMTLYATVKSPFNNRFPQGLYDEQLSQRADDEWVYIYTKGIDTMPPNGSKVAMPC